MCNSSLCSLCFVLVVIGCECTLSVFPPRLKLKRWSSHLENPFRFWIEVFSKWLEIGMACRFWNRPWRCRLSRFWPWWRRPHRSSWSSSWPCWRRVCRSRSPRCASRFWRRRVRHYYKVYLSKYQNILLYLQLFHFCVSLRKQVPAFWKL